MAEGIDTTNMTASEIDNIKVETEKKLRKAQEDLHIVELAELELAKEIINLQSKRKDLQISLSKARQIVRTLVLDIKILVSEFWDKRNG
jgi:hypothetical protein